MAEFFKFIYCHWCLTEVQVMQLSLKSFMTNHPIFIVSSSAMIWLRVPLRIVTYIVYNSVYVFTSIFSYRCLLDDGFFTCLQKRRSFCTINDK